MLLNRAAFYWHFFHRDFAEALIHWERAGGGDGTLAHYARYRLGLYATVAAKPISSNWPSAMASIVSLAACGRTQEAETLTRQALRRGLLKWRRTALAHALAPYMPALALEMIDGYRTSPSLRAALCLQLNKSDAALSVLREAITGGKQQAEPELYLLLSNAESAEPARRLDRLNDFFLAHGLSPVGLRDPAVPPSVRNLQGELVARTVEGPLVTVLMTAFRTGDRIRMALESLLAQTYRNLEIIVIDDASDDDTEEVVRSLANTDPRVRYIRLPCNVGTYGAKNIGLEHARGEFITCQDSDDWAHPMKIAVQAQPLIDNPRLVWTTSQWIRVTDEGTYYARAVYPLKRLNPASPMFRKDRVLREAGGWDWVRTGADSEFYTRLRLIFGRNATKRISKPLTLGAQRPNSLMTAPATGYNAAGVSPSRLEYWESWTAWHIDLLRRGVKPKLSMNLCGMRAFPAPKDIEVSSEAITAIAV